MHLNEFLDFSVTVSILADASSRALGGIIGKIKELKNVTLKVFERLYNSGVCPIMITVLVFGPFLSTIRSMLSNTKQCVFSLVLASLVNALYGDIGWLMPKYRWWLSMVRLWNRFVSLNDSRLTRAVFLQNVSIRKTGGERYKYIN